MCGRYNLIRIVRNGSELVRANGSEHRSQGGEVHDRKNREIR